VQKSSDWISAKISVDSVVCYIRTCELLAVICWAICCLKNTSCNGYFTQICQIPGLVIILFNTCTCMNCCFICVLLDIKYSALMLF